MSKKIKPEELQDLTTEELKDVVEGAIVEILGDELIVVESPVLLEPEKKINTGNEKVFEFRDRGHNHNAIAAMLGIDSDAVKAILEGGK